MVGVQDYIDCTKCGQKYCFYEFQTRTGRKYFNCHRCGYCFDGETHYTPDGAYIEIPEENTSICSSQGGYKNKDLPKLISDFKVSLKLGKIKDLLYTHKDKGVWMITSLAEDRTNTYEEYEVAGRI